MGTIEIREPIQKRSIEKKEKIIKSGFDLICAQGYHNTNTAQIAKKSGVSTGIVYQYFKDKHDIFIAGLEKYADNIFYPMLDLPEETFDTKNLSQIMRKMIEKYLENHKLSQAAHEEIMAMTHSDQEVAYYFHKREMDMTHKISDMLRKNGFNENHLDEKVHVIIGIIDNLCHEIVYHQHASLDYQEMTNIVIDTIVSILE